MNAIETTLLSVAFAAIMAMLGFVWRTASRSLEQLAILSERLTGLEKLMTAELLEVKRKLDEHVREPGHSETIRRVSLLEAAVHMKKHAD